MESSQYAILIMLVLILVCYFINSYRINKLTNRVNNLYKLLDLVYKDTKVIKDYNNSVYSIRSRIAQLEITINKLVSNQRKIKIK